MTKLSVGTILKNKDGSEAMVTAITEKGHIWLSAQGFSSVEVAKESGWIIPKETTKNRFQGIWDDGDFNTSKEERWKPIQEGEPYYYVDTNLQVMKVIWCGDELDKGRYEIGNCFRTPEEAEEKAEQIKKILSE